MWHKADFFNTFVAVSTNEAKYDLNWLSKVLQILEVLTWNEGVWISQKEHHSDVRHSQIRSRESFVYFFSNFKLALENFTKQEFQDVYKILISQIGQILTWIIDSNEDLTY